MRELKGETTVFYSTHILDDVQRVSDHVAILDHGRLVKAAPTQSLLGSFTKNMLRVVLGGATRETEAEILRLPGVESAVVTSRTGAALQDVINTARRRWRGCRLLLLDARVQGAAAAPQIADGHEPGERIVLGPQSVQRPGAQTGLTELL
jgi:ABC-type multidrug transport system ATPase subunit